MRLLDLLAATRHAFAHGTRTALTLLGVVIGTASIVLLASLVKGGEDALLHANQEVSDADVIRVAREPLPSARSERPSRELSREDARALAEAGHALDGVSVAAESQRETRALYQGRTKRARLVSATPATLTTYRLAVEAGRFLDDHDRAERRRVCVVGQEVFRELIAPRGDLAELHIVAEGESWTVVGVLAKKPFLGATDSTWVWDRKILVPDTTFDATFAPSHEVERLYVRKGRAPMASARAAVRALLLRRHLGAENFKLDDGKSAEKERLILGTIEALLLTTGLLALFASGINIMNVMLVTVTERTREIGLRRALGATRASIIVQFLLESAAVSLVGGAVGVLLGGGIAWAASAALQQAVGRWPLYLPAWSAGAGLALALLTGVGFGLMPALRAARVEPATALRSE